MCFLVIRDIGNYWYMELRFLSLTLLSYHCGFWLISPGTDVFAFTYKLFSIWASIPISVSYLPSARVQFDN